MELKLKMSHMLSINNDNAANFYVTDTDRKKVCICIHSDCTVFVVDHINFLFVLLANLLTTSYLIDVYVGALK